MKKTILFCILFFLSVISMEGKTDSYQNQKPFTIPELKEWKGDSGHFDPNTSRIIAESPEALEAAQAFSKDYETMFHHSLAIVQEKPRKGDIIFKLDPKHPHGEEAYSIRLSKTVTVTASSPKGLFWASRTLLQLTESSENGLWPKGSLTDYPDYPIRGFMIDAGRKFIPISYLRDFVKIMAYYKMNTFQIHLNDCGICKTPDYNWSKIYSGFRLECDTYPGLTAPDGHYTKQEFIDLQLLAEQNAVEIIPEIDTPAHSLAFSRYKPEIGSKQYGMDHLDLFNPDTYTFIDQLWAEYLEGKNPVFRGPKVHIGTDEYSNKDQKVVEKFREYTDHYIKYVESYGKQACLWGALTHAKGSTPVKSENVIMGAWYNGYADPEDMIEQGYQLISINDAQLYIVPAAGYYHDYLDTRMLYDEWTPAHVGNVVFEEKHPSILGGMFAVWNDHIGNGISVKDIHHRCYPALQTLAAKTWSAQPQSLSYDAFNQMRSCLSEAPGVNQMGRLSTRPALVYEKAELQPGEQLPFEEIGYDYRISFDLEPAHEDKGTLLLSSENARFYLSDPITGQMGYERDGYLNTFPFCIRPGEKVNIAIEGNSSTTQLYVNQQLYATLDSELLFRENPVNQAKDPYRNVRTLVFPLRCAGMFQSQITNFQVYQTSNTGLTHSTYLVENRIPDLDYVEQIDYTQFDYIYFMGQSPWNKADFSRQTEEILQELVTDHHYRSSEGVALAPRVIENAHKAGSKVLISFAGNGFKPLVETEAIRPKFIAYLCAFCEKYNYDGIDIDWEHDVTPAYHELFIREIREGLDQVEKRTGKRLYLTSALNSSITFTAEQAKSLTDYIDWINVMTYDFGGGDWGKTATHNTPMDAIQQNMKKWDLFPKEKICLGLANYGYIYRGIRPGQTVQEGLRTRAHANSITYTQALELMKDGWKMVYDKTAQVPYYYSPDGKDFFTIDNPESIQTKLEWCKRQAYNGVFWWEFTMDTYRPGNEGKLRHYLFDLIK